MLSLDLQVDDDGDAHLIGAAPQETVWINEVPEPKSVKHRVHVDVNTRAVADVEAAGATVLDDSFRWTVMADPEGGELCAFVRDADGPSLYEIVVDCADAKAQATWWGEVLGGSIVHDDNAGFSWVEAVPDASFECLVFVLVPEPKSAKNRVHLDLWCDAVDDLLHAGATLLRAEDDEIDWTVLADPEGNEFCAFTPS